VLESSQRRMTRWTYELIAADRLAVTRVAGASRDGRPSIFTSRATYRRVSR
jgi:hypothetical protein